MKELEKQKVCPGIVYPRNVGEATSVKSHQHGCLNKVRAMKMLDDDDDNINGHAKTEWSKLLRP